MNPYDINDATLQQLIYRQSLQQGNDFLNQNLQQQQALGMNPQIQSAQNQGNLGIAQAGQGIINQPTAQVSNMYYDPNNQQAMLAQALAARGPNDFIPGTTGSRLLGGTTTTPGAMQAGIRDWSRAMDNANFWANSSFYGGGLKQLTPDQQQAMQDATTLQHVGTGQALLQGAQQQQGVNPALMAQYADLAQKNIASGNTLAAEKYKAQADANKQVAMNKTELEKARIMGNAQVEAASVAGRNRPPTATELKVQEKADEANQTLAQVDGLIDGFDPNYFTSAGQKGAAFSDALGRIGINSGTKPQGFDQFHLQLQDVGNQYIKVVGGSRAISQKAARDYVQKAVANAEQDPTSAAHALYEMAARMHLAVNYANQKAAEAAQRGQYWNKDAPENADAIAKYATSDPNALNVARKAVVDQHNKLAQWLANQGDPIIIDGQPYGSNARRAGAFVNGEAAKRALPQASQSDIQKALSRGFKQLPNGQWVKG